jgi:hypothetical protein
VNIKMRPLNQEQLPQNVLIFDMGMIASYHVPNLAPSNHSC